VWLLLVTRASSMNFNAIIDLVKYTLAFTAACFVYALERLTPAPTAEERWLVLGLLAVFVIAALAGIFIFSAATAALHGDAERARRQELRIKLGAYAHIGFLGVGVLLLGGKLMNRVLTDLPKPLVACCTPSPAKP
jgi:hypothetical protein